VQFGLGASVYDWKDPFGRLFLQTLAMVAEFEANLGHLRTREGMALAKRQGNSPISPNPRSGRSAAATPSAKSPSRSLPPNFQSTTSGPRSGTMPAVCWEAES
jgi:DNA invertase Pin-like site-specific DNA recombinase